MNGESIPRPGGPSSGERRRVLVVDDEEPLARVVSTYLERDGFDVAVAADGPAALDLARSHDPELVVLDLGLPGMDGLEVCRRLRTFSDCYLIMLTARGEEVDKIVGLAVGADDYVTKPFSPRELMARVHVLLRRPRKQANTPHPGHPAAPDVELHPPLQFGPLSVDLLAREVLLAGQPVELTRTEFDVLAALASRPHMAHSRQQLIETVWGGTWVGDEHLVDVHVAHLRRKLGDEATSPRFIRTIRGIGYRMGQGQ